MNNTTKNTYPTIEELSTEELKSRLHNVIITMADIRVDLRFIRLTGAKYSNGQTKESWEYVLQQYTEKVEKIRIELAKRS